MSFKDNERHITFTHLFLGYIKGPTHAVEI